MLAGMSFFDAINHTFAALSTGGFSTRDAGMADFSNLAQWICALFMFLGSLPFLLFLQALQKKILKRLFITNKLSDSHCLFWLPVYF